MKETIQITLDNFKKLREQKLTVGEALVTVMHEDEMSMKEISDVLVFTPQAARIAQIRGSVKLSGL